MRISFSAVAVVTLWQLACGKRKDEPRRMRGGARHSASFEGHAGDPLAPEAVSGQSANEDVDFLRLKFMAVDQTNVVDKSTKSWKLFSGKSTKTSKSTKSSKVSKNTSNKSSSSIDDPEEPTISSPISSPYKYESSKWEARKIKANVILDVDAFDEAVTAWSKSLCDLGITATLFDNKSEMIYQKTVGTMYTPLADGGYSTTSGHGPLEEGWTGDTVFTSYSNSKGVATATFLSSVVDAGLGYLDEPISTTFLDLKGSQVGQITPRQIMSHSSGLTTFNREDFQSDPYYSCKYDESKSLRECLETFMLTDDQLTDPPGIMTRYNNEAFDILAVVAPQKTGMKNFGEIYQKYIAGPLGMDSTTYDCPVVKSTREKPGVAWGLCSTGNDFPKFVRMLADNGMSPSGKEVLSKDSVHQMFSPGGGSARNTGDMLWDAQLPLYMTRCYPRMVKGILKGVAPALAETSFPVTSVSGYGLGTMFFLGNYGEMFGHLGSTGGTWIVAPGRFSAYLTWMASGTVEPEISSLAYNLIADIVNALENASTFTVKSDLGAEDGQQDIGMCGDMYEDLFASFGVDSIDPLVTLVAGNLQCPNAERRLPATEIHPLSTALRIAGNPAFNLL